MQTKITYAFIALATLVIAVLSGLSFQQHHHIRELMEAPPPPVETPEGPRGPRGQMINRQIRQELDFTEEQLKEVGNLRKSFHKEVGQLEGQIRMLQGILIHSSIHEPENTTRMDSILNAMSKHFLQQQEYKLNYMLNMREVATPEQQAQMDSLMKSMMHRDINRGPGYQGSSKGRKGRKGKFRKSSI